MSRDSRAMQHPPITLRYFDARGRAQFLRYYFRVRKVSFTDDRVALAADFAPWRAVRDDRSRTGPFHKLPVLHWGDRLIAESLLIASFVHEASGDEGSLSDDDNLRHGMLTSSLYCDVTMQIGTLLWAELMFPGCDVGAVAKGILERLERHCRSIDQSLGEWRWLDKARNRRIMLADCMLFEVLSTVQHVFGPRFALAQTPMLARFYDDFPARQICESMLAEQPCPITARHDEAAVIAKIRELVA
jgi:glutathione S-transferase